MYVTPEQIQAAHTTEFSGAYPSIDPVTAGQRHHPHPTLPHRGGGLRTVLVIGAAARVCK